MAAEPLETSEREQHLDRVLGEYLEAADRGQAPNRHIFLAQHPELAGELREFFDNQEQFRSLTHALRAEMEDAAERGWPLPALAVVSPDDSSSRQQPPASFLSGLGSGLAPGSADGSIGSGTPGSFDPESLPPLPADRRFGKFELLEPLGRGGMGMVFRARQLKPVRLVALKMMGTGWWPSDRLLDEADLAAHLDHPSIVPIYEVGQFQGHHYFSMRLIEGGDLSRHLERYRSDHRAAVALVAAVARAVHYAHQRGVLHLDLKPSNILIDAAGAPLVSDFGLARWFEAGPADAEGPGPEPVGTLPYMAPEQAANDRAAITTATDVHGLGALLYALLTGCPPHRAECAVTTLDRVKNRLPDPPLEGRASAELDLNAICMKCLQKEPERRYASAANVAADLDRWLARRPVSARPLGPVSRLWRTCRRYPVTASLLTAVAALLAVAVTGLVVFSAALWREQSRTATALARTRELTARYRDVIDRMYVRLAEERLFDQPQMEGLQRELLTEALQAYQAVAARPDADPAMRLEAARACARVAEIDLVLGRHDEAEAASRDALEQFSRLVPADPARGADARHELAAAHRLLGRVLAARNRMTPAEAELRAALGLEEALVATAPTNSEYQLGRARCESSLATLFESTGRIPQAQAAFLCARAAYAAVSPVVMATPSYRSEVAGMLNDLALLLQAEGKLEEARNALEDAIQKQLAAVEARPRHPRYRWFLANHRANCAEVLLQLGQVALAGDAGREALAEYQALAHDFPGVPSYRKALAASHTSLGRLLETTGDVESARTHLEAARSAGRGLVLDFPSVPGYRHDLVGTLISLGQLNESLGRHQEASACFSEATELGDQLAALPDSLPEDLSRLVTAQLALSRQLRRAGDSKAADLLVQQAVSSSRSLAQKLPSRPDYLHALASSHVTAGSLLRASGRLVEAEQLDRASLAALQALVADIPDRPGYRHDLARVYDELGDLCAASQRQAEAEQAYLQALAIQEELASYHPRVPHYRFDLAQTLCSLARAGRAGAHQGQQERHCREAIALLEQLRRESPEIEPYRQALAEAYIELGMSLMAAQRFTDAESVLRAAVKECRDLVAASSARGEHRSALASALNGLATALAIASKSQPDGPVSLTEARDLLTEAVTEQSAALGADPENPDYRSKLRIQFTNLARALASLGDHAGMARVADEMGTALRDHADARIWAGRIASQALELAQHDGALSEEGHSRAARSYAEQGVAQLTAAAELLAKGRPPGLDRSAARAAIGQGLNRIAWFLAARPDASLRNPTRAVEIARQGLEHLPADPALLGTLGMACYRVGNYGEARTALEQAMQKRRENLDPADALALAMTCWQIGHKEEARQWLNRAVAGMEKAGRPSDDWKQLRDEAESIITPQPQPGDAERATQGASP